jgi:hypothetical protein
MNHPVPGTNDALSTQIIIPQKQVGRKSGTYMIYQIKGFKDSTNKMEIKDRQVRLKIKNAKLENETHTFIKFLQAKF